MHFVGIIISTCLYANADMNDEKTTKIIAICLIILNLFFFTKRLTEYLI